LRLIRDRFPVGPPGRAYAPAQFGEFGLGEMHSKWSNAVVRSGGDAVITLGHICCASRHGALLNKP
jgi:hypothetical protein